MLPTFQMRVNQLWYLIQQKRLQFHFSQPLFQSASAMGNDLDDLVDEDVIWGNLRVPRVDEFLEYDGDYRVQLEVDFVGTRQWREQLIHGLWRAPPLLSSWTGQGMMGAQCSAYEGSRCLVGEEVGGGFG